MDNHIQLPKFLIKNFAADDGKVFVYSIVDGKFFRRAPRTIGTAVDYYDTDVEFALNKVVETKFAKTIRELFFDVSHELPCIINEQSRINILNFIFINYLRSNKALNETAEQLLSKDLSSEIEIHNDILTIGLRHAQLHQLPIQFDHVKIEMIINEAAIPFISSRHGCCDIPRINPTKTFYPISPRLAILLTVMKNNCEADCGAKPWFIEEREVIKLNQAIYEQECEYNNSFLISRSKETLLQAVSYRG